MSAIITRRLLTIVVTLFVVSVVVFLLLRLAPGDPATLILGDTGNSARIAKVRAEMGLDQPLPVQYFLWLGHVIRGDLGTSFMTGEPVAQALWRHFLVTLQLITPAFIISLLFAIPIGILAGWRQDTKLDLAIVGSASVFVSMPSFVVALLLNLVFGIALGWLPTMGFVSLGDGPLTWLQHIILPVTALLIVEAGILIRFMRTNTIEVLNQDYIAYARSKGLSEWELLRLHVFKNTLAPTLSLVGLMLSSLLSGTAVIETVYSIPGLGRFLVDAVYARDYPVIQGVLLFVVVVYAVVNLVFELIQPLLDPRVRLT